MRIFAKGLVRAMLVAFLPASALAAPVTYLHRAPADPAAIPVTVNQSALSGEISATDFRDLVEAGRQLFDTKFTIADGAGRPGATQATIPTHFKRPRELAFQRASGPDANSCTSCHNDPIAGGAGHFTTNAFTSQGTESADFDNVDPQFSNERGTNHMFGAGLMELLAREMTADLHAIRVDALNEARNSGLPVTAPLVSKGISFGALTLHPDGVLDVSKVEGIDPDLTVRPFSQKGVIPSLRMFTVSALNAHHGIQAEERFGPTSTGEADFDGDGFDTEFTMGQVSALIAYQATLAPPVRIEFSKPEWQMSAQNGSDLFEQVGCNSCHVSSLPLESTIFADPGPNDSAGTLSAADVDEPARYDLAMIDGIANLPRDDQGRILVPLFGDLKRHQIADNQQSHFANELMGQAFVARDAFMTSELWGVADTAPYGHRGDVTTLQQAIGHHGGEAAASRLQFMALPDSDQDDLVTFLMSLRMPQ